MKELSLFTGCGGGIYGSKLLGWQTIGYVEHDKYCQAIISQRIRDGIFDFAPVFSDVRTFAHTYAKSFQGVVDVITAGFPCQPFSTAGRRKADQDDRNMWPATIDVIRKVQPKWCLLENVPGLLGRHGYFGTVLKDLAEAGFDAEWDCLSASEVGAPHKRERLWILATNTNRHKLRVESKSVCELYEEAELKHDGKNKPMADSTSNRLERSNEPKCSGKSSSAGVFPESLGSDSGTGGWWTVEPNVGRVAHGVAFRRNRLGAIGNGQVPLVVKTAWKKLNR